MKILWIDICAIQINNILIIIIDMQILTTGFTRFFNTSRSKKFDSQQALLPCSLPRHNFFPFTDFNAAILALIPMPLTPLGWKGQSFKLTTLSIDL